MLHVTYHVGRSIASAILRVVAKCYSPPVSALRQHCNEPSRWPTVPIVRKIAGLFRVDVAELGAFFGLLR